MLNNIAGRVAFISSPPLATETVDTFASDCATPKSTFVLGETVCAQVNGAPLPSVFGFRQRRFQWVDPSGRVVQQTEITTDPQDDTFTVPTTGPLAQVGTWAVRLIKNNGSTVALTRFVVSDPANLRADLSVGKYGQLDVKSGNNAKYLISVENRGPDGAQGVSLTDDVPANMTFVSATQTTGPTFNCSNPSSGGSGTSTCTIATLARDERATFTFIYEVIPGTPIGTTIENTVSASSSTTELEPADNSAMAPVSVIGIGSGGDECVISCPADVTEVAGANESGAIVSYPDPTATGSSCGAVSCSPSSGTFFPIGTTTVVCAAEAGDPCSFNVTVEDNQDPTISCPTDISVSEDPATPGSAIVTYPAPSASDNSGVVSVSCDHASPSSFPTGTTTVTCTATDDSGNTASCPFTVTVTGNGCTLSCPANITVDAAPDSCGAMVTFDPAASQDCGAVTSMPASGSIFPVGTTTVHVTSEFGQSCSFTVTVVDNVAPIITSCPDAITVTAASGSCSATVIPETVTATDNCSATVTVARSDGVPITNTTYPVGTTTITWTATDGAGNTASCDQTVTVQDLVPPTVTINVPPAVATVIADANCEALIPDIGPYTTATDNCTQPAFLTITQSPAAETVVGTGAHTITVTVVEGDPDGQHNTTTATTVFTVIDGTPPVLTVNGANPLVVECHTSLVDPGASASDNCAANPVVTATNDVNVNVPGNYTITYTTTDGTNTVTATRDVTVVDTIAPVITINGANPMTVECHTGFSDPGATATDSCAGSVPVTASGAVNANVPGIYTITYTSTDGTNTATATRTVNVVDTTAPTITMTGLQINLWPPNHNYHTINLTQLVAGASDGCDGGLDIGDVVISKVTSDETENGGGDGNTLNDIVIAANCKSVQLRAERNGGGNGRVYTIHFRVTDASSNVRTTTAQVKVPKSQGNGGGAIDSGVQYTVNGTCP